MQAVILSVGDELTGGATLDTNSAYLSRRLAERGVATLRHVTVGDDAGAIAAAITEAARTAKLVLLTGGLGPTKDDLTRRGLAQAMGVELREDPRCLERIAAFFAARGRDVRPSNRSQALIPEGAEAVDNDCGTAPGIAARLGSARIFVLPGPPHEMAEMFDKEIAARLPAAGAIVRKVVRTFGAGESDVGERIADLVGAGNPQVGTTVSAGVVSVRITASCRTPRAAATTAEQTAAEVRRRLGGLVFGQDDETLPAVVGKALRAAGATLALAESCTGGLLGEMITSVPGASEYFLGGVVCYGNEAKMKLLGVPESLIAAHGAVSEPVAAAMADGARRGLGSDWAIGVTGIAGPTGGTREKPVGLVFIAIAAPAGTQVRRRVFSGTREVIRRRAALAALNRLRLAL